MSKLIFRHLFLIPNYPCEEESGMIIDFDKRDFTEEQRAALLPYSDFTTFELTMEEYEALNKPDGWVDFINDRYDLMIDYFENDFIPTAKIRDAIECTKQFITHNHSEIGMTALRKVMQALEYAEKMGAYCEVTTYLKGTIDE